MQTFIDYGSDLVYKPQSIAAEIVWPDANVNVRDQIGSGLVNHGALSGLIPPLPVSNFEGNVVELVFNCSAGPSQTTIDLLPEGDPVASTSGAQFKEPPNTAIIPKVGSLTINCVVPPTPPPTKMALSVQGGDCDAETSKCNVLVGSQFTVSVDAIAVPASGYISMQTFIDYGSNLVYKPQSIGAEIVWPGAVAEVRGEVGSGLVNHGALSGLTPPLPISSYTGTLVKVTFTCSANPSVTTIVLLPEGDPVALTNGTKFTPPSGGSVVPILNSVTINCLGAEETVTETIGTAGGSVSTGTGDPVETTLDVPENALPDNIEITIDVFVSQILPTVGDAQTLGLAFRFEPNGLAFDFPYPTVTISYTDAEVAGIDESKMDILVCDSATDECELADVISRDKVENTVTISMPHFSDVFLCRTDDCDEDGCTNTAEEGADQTTGGLRDMRNRSDYYDINDDQFVDLSNDIFDVIQHYAPSGTEPEYDVNYDRGPSEGPNVWNMTAPDGVIDLSNDIFGVIQQYFHDCR